MSDTAIPPEDADFSWKVRWRMRHDQNPLFITLQDKYALREYAAQRGVRTARLLLVTEAPETIPFDRLPSGYFIKASHGSRWNILCEGSELYFFRTGSHLITRDDAHFDRAAAAPYRLTREQCVRLCAQWLGQTYSRDEWAYRHIRPRILIEERLAPHDGVELKDYRLYTFDGAVAAINVGSPRYRRDGENVFFRPDWTEIKLSAYKEKLPSPLPAKPDTLPQMLYAAARLGRGLDFARIDLYDSSEGVVLGEITIYPEAGLPDTPTACPIFNRWLGDHWVLPAPRKMVRIEPIRAEHAREFHTLFDRVARERRYLGAIAAPPLEWIEGLVRRNAQEDVPHFVAIGDDTLVGWCEIEVNPNPGYRHGGRLTMGLLDGWRGRGIGRALLNAAIGKAWSKGLTRIEAETYASNAPALRLYENFGFAREGVKRNARFLDGNYEDTILLAVLKPAP